MASSAKRERTDGRQPCCTRLRDAVCVVNLFASWQLKETQSQLDVSEGRMS